MAGVIRARAQLALLLRLHFRLLLRRATATPGRRLVSTLLVTLGAVASILLAGTGLLGMWVARNRTGFSAAQLDEGIHLAFAAVYLVIVLSPALGFRGSDFLDVTRLFHLPVSHRTVFTASSLGILASGAVLFWLPPLVGLVYGHQLPARATWFGNRPDHGALDGGLLSLRLGLVLAFLLHAVALGQVVMLLLLNFLRSRRFRDLGMVVAPVVAGAVYLGTWFVLARGRGRAGEGTGIFRDLLSRGISEHLPFLPSRWLTGAMVEPGTPAAWLPFLLGFLPLTVLLFLGAAHLQERAFLGSVPPLEPGRGGLGRRIPGGRWLRRFLPDPVLAVASKELRLLGREPIVKTLLISQTVFLLGIVLVLALRPGTPGDPFGTVTRFSWTVPFVLVFVQNTLTMNLLGLEGPGVGHLLTTPTPWRRVLAGKDLCYLAGFGTLNALVSAAALAALAHLRPGAVPDLPASIALAAVGGTCALAVVLAVGNVLSVAMPTPLTVRGRMALRQQASFSEGCYEKLTRNAVFAGAILLVLPVPFLLHILPGFGKELVFQEPWWPAAGAVLSGVYAAALLRASLPVAAEMAREGEEAILRRLTRSEE